MHERFVVHRDTGVERAVRHTRPIALRDMVSILLLLDALLHVALGVYHFEHSVHDALLYFGIALAQCAYALTLRRTQSGALRAVVLLGNCFNLFLLNSVTFHGNILFQTVAAATDHVHVASVASTVSALRFDWLDLHSAIFEALSIIVSTRLLFTLRTTRPVLPGRLGLAPLLIAMLALAACTANPDIPDLNAQPTAHETDEGLPLGTNNQESVYAGALCVPSATVRQYNVAAINVEITLNRYLDYDPQGRMYVLEEDLARVRADKRRTEQEARAGPARSPPSRSACRATRSSRSRCAWTRASACASR